MRNFFFLLLLSVKIVIVKSCLNFFFALFFLGMRFILLNVCCCCFLKIYLLSRVSEGKRKICNFSALLLDLLCHVININILFLIWKYYKLFKKKSCLIFIFNKKRIDFSTNKFIKSNLSDLLRHFFNKVLVLKQRHSDKVLKSTQANSVSKR